MKIGFFDSGLGGLTILRAVAKALPEYDYDYYGDTVHLPYGDKSEAEVYTYTKEAVGALFERGSVLVIIACNTASAETLRQLQDEWLPTAYPDRRILGVIIPTIETLIETGSRHALLLATTRTVESKKYDRELSLRSHTSVTLHSVATPALVPSIEQGDMTTAVNHAQTIIEATRREVPQLDTVVLGCTHYTELTAPLRKHYGEALRILSQDEIIPNKLKEYLDRHPEIMDRLTHSGTRTIFLSQHRPDYDRITAQLLHGAYMSGDE